MYRNDSQLKSQYLDQYAINAWFSFDIAPYAALCTFQKGDYLCFEDTPTYNLYFLVKGKTKAYTTCEDGQISLIEFNSPVSMIGEMELIGMRKTTIAVRALEPCVCISIQVDQCKDKLLQDAHFLLRLSQYLGNRIILNTRNFVTNQSTSLEERLCIFILAVQQNGYFCEKLTETSEYLGVSYRHLQRIIGKLCDQNVLSRTKNGYLIQDIDYLTTHSLPPSTI